MRGPEIREGQVSLTLVLQSQVCLYLGEVQSVTTCFCSLMPLYSLRASLSLRDSESRVVTGPLALVTLGQPSRLSQAARKNQLGSFNRSWCQESDLICLGGASSAVLLSENNYEF